MKTLQGFNDGDVGPVHRFHVPDSNGSHDAAQAESEETNGDNGQYDRSHGQILLWID